MLIAWCAIVGLLSLGVDFGRVELAKTELMVAADSASRAAAAALPSGITAVQNAAVSWGGYNTASGSSVVIDPNNDIDFGNWDWSGRTFTTLTGAARSGANSVRVSARQQAARSTGVPLMFAQTLGFATCDTSYTVIARASSTVDLLNSDFESPTLASNTYVYNQTMSGWTLTGEACLETYGSAWGGPQPSGNQAIALQGSSYGAAGSISQSFTSGTGSYQVLFLASRRSYYVGNPTQPVSITVDGVQMGLITPSNYTFQTYTTSWFHLNTGLHTLALSATDTSSGDRTTFVDAVVITSSVPMITSVK